MPIALQQVGSAHADGISAQADSLRWPEWRVLFTAWLLPATTARRTQHFSLKTAFFMHILVACMVTALAFLFSCWRFGQNVWIELGRMINALVEACSRNPGELVLVGVSVIGAVEGGLLVLALLMASWGAADEPWRSSISNAVRNVWLQLAAVLPWALIIGCVVVALARSQTRDWQERNRVVAAVHRPEWMGTTSGPADPEERRQILIAYRTRLIEEENRWRSRRTWYQREPDLVLAWSGVFAGGHVLWVLFRAIGARREVPAISRPPACDACGYDLSGTSEEGTCPECGRPAAESIRQTARVGTSWERRRQIGLLRAWWRTTCLAATQPTALGRQLLVSRRIGDHRWYVAGHLAAFLAIGYAAIIGFYYSAGPPPHLDRSFTRQSVTEHIKNDLVLWEDAPATGAMLLAGYLAVTLFSAGLTGLWIGITTRRNLVPAAMQMGAYLSPFLLVCVATSILFGMALVGSVQGGWFDAPAERLHLDPKVIAAFLWGLICLLLLEWYIVLLYKGTAGARYANR